MYGVNWLLKKFDLYPNDYYNYLKNRKAEYLKQKYRLMNLIKDKYHEHNGTIGYRMICDLLNRQGVECSYGTVYSYMHEMKLKATILRKKPKYEKGTKHKIFDNLLKRDFSADGPNQIWCTDFTYLALKNGKKRFNCSILDLHDRSIVASLNSKWIDSGLAIETLKMALGLNKVDKNLVLHSDQGSQFASRDFINFCSEHNVIQSMSRAGNPYDNAPMERFYNTFKAELIYQYDFETDLELNEAVNDYIFDWYNYRRPHSFNKGMTPFEARHLN